MNINSEQVIQGTDILYNYLEVNKSLYFSRQQYHLRLYFRQVFYVKIKNFFFVAKYVYRAQQLRGKTLWNILLGFQNVLKKIQTKAETYP